MAAPLTNRQKAYLAILAQRAWRQAPEADALDANAWRHEQVAAACGKKGLRCCSQNDYGAVKARFLDLVGEPGRALAADVHGRAELNERRQVLWKIRARCREYGVSEALADGICRQMTRGRGLVEVEESSTLWNVYFKLRYYETNNNENKKGKL